MPYDLAEAITILESGRTCSLTIVKADTRKSTGGEVISFNKCKIARRQAQLKERTIAVKGEGRVKARDANHAFNFTRNVELADGSIRTVHPLLIVSINGIPVL